MPKRQKQDNLYKALAIFACSALFFTLISISVSASFPDIFVKATNDELTAEEWNHLQDLFLFKSPIGGVILNQKIEDNIGIGMEVVENFKLSVGGDITANEFVGNVKASNITGGTPATFCSNTKESCADDFMFPNNLFFDSGKSIAISNDTADTKLLIGNYSNENDFEFGKNFSASLLVEGAVKANELCFQNDCKSGWDDIIPEDPEDGLWSQDGTKIFPNEDTWRVGIGTNDPGYLLDVDGTAQFTEIQMYNENIEEPSEYPVLNMNWGRILQVDKITVGTIDPLYRIDGINYSTFASAIVGGVKEELISRVLIDRKNGAGEYEQVIDFSKVERGSELWVWYYTVDFNKDNIEVLITPYGSFAQTYYLIEGDKLIFRSDRPIEASYRLMGKRFDWRNWPLKADDQEEVPSFTIETK